MPSFTTTTSTTWTVPSNADVTSIGVYAWGESGNAGTSAHGSHSGGGSGAGAFGGEPALGGLVAGSTVLTITIGTGGTGTNTTVTGGSVTVQANAGGSASGQTQGSGGPAGSNTIAFKGGDGAAGLSGATQTGGGGGGSAGSTGAGGAGSSGTGGPAGTGAAGPPSLAGVAGQNGAGTTANGANGTGPGGGASGGGSGGTTNHTGGNGAPGQVIIIWSTLTWTAQGYAASTGTVATAKKALSGFAGLMSWTGAPLPVAVVNAWKGTFAQPAAFGTMPPALQSVPVALTPANSVGGGSGYSTPGNWLFCVVGISEPSATSGVTVGDADDIHSWWRPGDVTMSTWAVSTETALTRTSVWYTPNIARQVNYVYAAPDGAADAISVLVFEVAGLGPWDVVTGIYANYAAAATSLNLTLAAPSAQAFLVAAVTGGNDTAGQSFAPAGWNALATVTATNGTDHTADCVLTTATLVTSGSVSVNGAASSAVDLSGVIIGVLTAAPSPISPEWSNPAWPGRTICEIALGGGFQTPPDELTWTVVSDSDPEWREANSPRLWNWRENSTGIQYQLGALQASDGNVQLDNFDAALTPANVASPFYSNALNSNMSFQSGTSPWTGQFGATLAQSSAFAFASAPGAQAKYSMQVNGNGSTATPEAASEQVPVTAGAYYSVSAWFYSASGWAPGVSVAIDWHASGGSYISTTGQVIVAPLAAGTWTQVVSTAVQAPAGAVTANIDVIIEGTPPSSQAFWIAEAALVSGTSAVRTGLVTAGLPVRLRVAVGTITTRESSVTYDRWYVISRNAYKVTERRDAALRSYVDVKLTDIWSVASASCPTPYRGEVEQDGPGWWWPCDDQALTGGVLPTSLRNAAKGSTTVLSIVPSPSGVASQDTYSSGIGFGAGGTDLTSTGGGAPNPSVAVYAVGQSQGWMYGDPQVSPQSAQTGNPVTAQPGSAAWQQTGLLGNTGSAGWALIANDTFPPVAAGVTISGWFNYKFLGSATGYTAVSTQYQVAQQPYCQLTLLEMATGSAPVAMLYLDISGHLILETFNGGTGTTHSIYTASDLRCNAFLRVTLQLTQSTYSVFLNAGLNTSGAVTGSCTISASAWSWLIANGDLGSNGGSLAGTGLQHGGNVQVSHLKIFSGLLPAYRELAQYSAAITGCGLLPAPTSVSAASVANFTPSGFTADGTEYKGSFASGTSGTPFTISALAASAAGGYTSGPAARTTIAARGGNTGTAFGAAVYVAFTALAPLVQVYTSASANAETEASAVLGSGEAYTGGYGSGATGAGVGHVSGGTGASPPAAASSLGDTVSQRLERILGYGGITVPMRAIDPAPLLVQAALDVGGQATGQNCINIQLSDDGLLTIDNCGTVGYRARPHLAADTPVWLLGPNVSAGQIPYEPDQSFGNDPVRVWNAVLTSPYSPDGASLADITPSNAAAVAVSQAQYGPKPLSQTSYLQSVSKIQAATNWLLATFGQVERRVEKLTVNAAPHPAAWVFVIGGNVGDVATVSDQPFGGPATSGNYRISQMQRSISFGANGTKPEASLTIIADPIPASFWS